MNDVTARSTAPAETRSVGERPFLAIGLVLLAVALFSAMDALSKTLAATYDPIEVVWGRYLVILLMLLPGVLRAPSRLLRTVHPLLQGLRGLAILGSALFFIAGLAQLPMADATAIAFISPLLVTALSIPFLGERVGPRRWSAVAAGFIGVLVVIRPGSGAVDRAAVLPLLSAACWAVSLVITRRMRSDDAPLTTLFYSTTTGFLASSLALPLVWRPIDLKAWVMMALMGALSAGGQYLLIRALIRSAASLLAPFTYSQMLWSTLLGFFIFGNVPALWTWLGAAIIIASGIYTAHRERLAQRARMRR